MLASKPSRRVRSRFGRLITALFLALTSAALALDLGLNPIIAPNGSLTLNGVDIFSGTLTIGASGQSGGSLFLANDYSTNLAIIFAGNGSQLNHPGVTRTLTITSGGSITRTGAGSTSFLENVTNGGTLTVNGGTLSSSALLTNQAAGSITVTGSGSVLNVTSFANSGTLRAENNGQLRFSGAITTAALGSASNITIASGGVIELASSAILTNTAANLAAPTGGSYLFNGTIVGGTIDATALTQSNGTLDGAVISGDASVPFSKSLTIKNGGGWTGTATIGTLGQSGGNLYLASDSTLTGGLVFTGTSSQLNQIGALRTLTSSGSITRTGAGSTSFAEKIVNSGTLIVNGGTLTLSELLTNQTGGSVSVTNGGSVLNLTTFANAGTFNADTNGQLRFTGAFTTAQLGSPANLTITNNGVIELASSGVLTNTSANLAAPTGGSYLFNGTIIGGTIDANALTQSNGTLDGAVISGNLTVGVGKALTIKNGGGWTGTATIGTAGQSGGSLYLGSDSTLAGALVFTGTSSQLNQVGALRTLTSTGSITRTGAGSTSVAEKIVNSGTLIVNGGTLTLSELLTNQTGGAVSVTGSGSILNLTTFSNAGTLNADNSGQLRFTGAFTTAQLGSPANITITNNGVIELASSGVLTNTSANLAAPMGGSYLFNGTIAGGTIDANALTQSNGTLDGAVISGNLTVGASKALTIKNGGGWTGTATIGTAGQSGGSLYLGSDSTLAGALVFTGTSSQLNQVGALRTLTSTGSITRTGTGSTSFAEKLVNSGTLTVNGGTLTLSEFLTNQAGGTVSVTGSGSILNLASFSNAGVFNADNSGQLRFTGAFTTAQLGSPANLTITNNGVIELASSGVLTNTSANLAAPTGGAYLFNGTIVGGTIDANALTQSNGTLDGAVVAGSLTVGAGKALTIKNGGGWTGTATIGTAGLSGGSLYLASDAILPTAIVFTGSSSQLNHIGGTRTVTITSTGSVTHIGTGTSFSAENILNGGSIVVGEGSFSSSGTLTNQAGGTIAVSNGATLTQSGAFTNQTGASAVVTGSGSKLAVANISNSGTLVSDNNALLSLTDTFTTAGLGTITLTHGGTVEIASSGILTNTATNLSAPSGGTYILNGTIVGGTIDANALTQSNGTLDGAVIAGGLTVGAGKSLTIKNGGGWTGTATLGTAGLSGGNLYLASDATLSTAIILTGSSSQLNHIGGTRTVTITSTGSVKRTGSTGISFSSENILNGGSIVVDDGTLSSSGTLTNQAGGTIAVSNGATLTQSGTFTNQVGASAVVSGSGSKLAVGNLVNSGTLVSDNSALLSLTGTFTTAGLGTITLTHGGKVEIASGGTLNNTSANLSAPTGGTYLLNGTIAGGTIDATALTQSNGTLDNSTINGDVAIPSGTSLTLINGGGWTGNAVIGTVGQSGGNLYLASDQTLGTAVTLTGSSSQVNHIGGTRTVTITSTGSVRRTGVGGISFSSENLLNGGSITVDGGTLSSSGTLANQSGGTILVSSGATFTQTGNFTNAAGGLATVTGTGSKLAVANLVNPGALVADLGGLLSLTGTFSTAGLGNITASNGGSVEFASGSTLNNASANLTAPNGGAYIFNGTILGGTIDAAALKQSAGVLDAATITGNVAIPAGASLTLKNGASFTGDATIGVTNQSNGILILGNDLTIGTNLTFAGSGSQLAHSTAIRTLSLSTGGSITRTGVGSTFSSENIQNSGTVTISGGTFSSTGAFTNKAGGSVTIASGAVFTQSTAAFTQTGGSLKVDGTLNPGSLGLAIQGGSVSGSGTIGGNVTVSGGTISPGGTNLGTLTLSSGTLAITGATAFEIDISGASADKLVFQNPPSAISLGTGLLSISVNLLSQPIPGTTYNILQVTSGANGITGTFAGFPTSGLGFNAVYQGTPYFFAINYQSNLVSLTVTPVPEPSTWALLGTGLAIVGWQVRRRRK